MTDDVFRVDDGGDVRRLTFTRPGRRNAVPPEGWRQLEGAFDDFERSDARVLIVSGEGGDFCAGADLGEGIGSGERPGLMTHIEWMRGPGAAAIALHRLSKPTVAAVDGVAVGAGMNLAIGCDIVIAGEEAHFAEIFVRRGLTLDFGGSWLLPRIVGLARARDLALTGRVFGAGEALEMGLVARVVPGDVLAETATEVAQQLAVGAPLAQRFIKVALDRSSALTFEQAVQLEDQAQAILLSSEDVVEGVAAFLEKRPPRFRGV